MKIENQSMPVINKQVNVGWASAQQWSLHIDSVEPDTRQADEYYWQHQHQLQQSDITFNPVEVNTPAPITPDRELAKDSINPMEKFSPESLTLSEFDMQQLNDIHRDIIAVSTESEPRPSGRGAILTFTLPDGRGSDSVETTRSINTILRKPLITPTSTSIFKHYQLFIDDNQVELTLNTAHLSKLQVIELQTFIRQWLNQKGYTLKQLVLNGEQQ